MTGFALVLLGIGVADLVGRLRWALLSGAATVLVGAALVGLLASPAGLGVTAISLLAVLAWEAARLVPAGREVWALAAFGASVLMPLLVGGLSPRVGGVFAAWWAWAALPWSGVTPDNLLLVAGLFLVQLNTANVVVRLVLTAVDAIPSANDGSAGPGGALKGGRILGPLERVFILGLGLAGQFGTAGLVVAAKGLIRWPEIAQTGAEARRPASIRDMTEYFLVGSFTSWLFALIGVALGST